MKPKEPHQDPTGEISGKIMTMHWDRKSASKADILAKVVVFHSTRKTTVISYSQRGGWMALGMCVPHLGMCVPHFLSTSQTCINL
jgi:hypothetical protein